MFHISYAIAIHLSKNKWSPAAMVAHGKAVTSDRPSVAPFAGASAQVIAAWRGPGLFAHVLYSVGTAEKGGVISWGSAFTVPAALTTQAPTVYSLLHSHEVFVTWRRAGSKDVLFEVGTPVKGGSGSIDWGKPGRIPGAATDSTPTVAEASTGASKGVLYVLWKAPGKAGRIFRAATSDPVSTKAVKWTAPVALPSAITTNSPPVAQAIGTGQTYPLLLVYRIGGGSLLRYVTIPARGRPSGPHPVPATPSADGPALQDGVLALRPPASSALDYRDVRPCGGCPPTY